MPRFYLRAPNPNDGRRVFRIYRDGHPLIDSRIDAVNSSLLAGTLDLTSAKGEANKVLRALKEAAKTKAVSYPDKNLDVLKQAIAAYSKKDHTPRTQKMGEASLRRCIGLLGGHILYSVSIQNLEHILASQSLKARPKLAVFLNLLLQTAGRAERLKVPAQPNPVVRYLTKDEFLRAVEKIAPELRLPVLVAFATGCRQGEVFGLDRLGRISSLWLTQQMFPTGEYGPPKGDKPGKPSHRWVTIMPWGKSYVEEWIGVDHLSRFAIRNIAWEDVVRNACKDVFPNQPHKHLNFRDIRHCYAIYWLNKGKSITHVSQSMGNSERILKRHYLGFIQTEEAEKALLEGE